MKLRLINFNIFYHKITSELSKQFELIAVEDLQVKNMTKRDMIDIVIHINHYKQRDEFYL
ncbi:hypothetical protein BGL59_06590 [Helicobacter pylori]|nr:hypothetical protein BGL56_03035 [Helicobacter pylori]OPG27575.1 hypothetical protein BGL59_06590 [Helicobacter pylori]